MIPVKLRIEGFLSYQQPVELDFSTFSLACISGPNGAGKSSLLDAITWALFGQARKRDESVINNNPTVSAAQVTLDFDYEGNRYRVQRVNPRGKTTAVEFFIWSQVGDGRWKPLTERTLRETDKRIEETLRMDFDTFTNASFFLQGKADQFATARPADRKRILSNILGLEIWETYREAASQQRRGKEKEVKTLDGRLSEIQTELDEEPERKQRLADLEARLAELTKQRMERSAILENVRRMRAALDEQAKMLATYQTQIENTTQNQARLQSTLAARQEEKAGYEEILAAAEAIEAAYQDWQTARTALEAMEELAAQFRQREALRHEPLGIIQAEEARLKAEQEGLLAQQATLEKSLNDRQEEKANIDQILASAEEIEKLYETWQVARKDLEAMDELAKQFRQRETLRQEPIRIIEVEKARLKQAKESIIEQRRTIEEVTIEKYRKEQARHDQILVSAEAIEKEYKAWKSAQNDLESIEELASRFRQLETQRHEPLRIIQSEEARLIQAKQGLLVQQTEIEETLSRLPDLIANLNIAQSNVKEISKKLAKKEKLQNDLNRLQTEKAEAKAENPRLREEMLELKTRIDHLNNTEGAQCPICGQPLSSEDRKVLIENLTQKGNDLGNRYRENQQILENIDKEFQRFESAIGEMDSVDLELREANRQVDQLEHQIDTLQDQVKAWLQNGSAQLDEITNTLENDSFAQNARDQLSEIDAKIAETNYDLNHHEQLRKTVIEGKEAEDKYHKIKQARLAKEQIEHEINTAETKGAELQEKLTEITETLEKNLFAQEAREKLLEIDTELENLGYDLKIHEDLRLSEVAGREAEEKLRQVEKAKTAKEQNQREIKELTTQVRAIKKNLDQVTTTIEDGTYANEARIQLQEIDVDIKSLGYDQEEHEKIRLSEISGRESEDQMRKLEGARKALAPIEREIEGLETQLKDLEKDLAAMTAAYDEAAVKYAAAEADLPDLEGAESDLHDIQEQENRLRQDVGAAKQTVAVLDTLKARKAGFQAEREGMTLHIVDLKLLERAFGKDGIPALLIEQALPEIEETTNALLSRLSNGRMSFNFLTQRAYKDANRDDLKETLDIVISDSVGERDYEMFSGGEAFRVNFSIRLALSQVLARRAGARLQTLVIDEGFGSQDAQGRQRLVEAINLVQDDFEKILVITHLDELKDAFPNRIEVEKTLAGSQLQVL